MQIKNLNIVSIVLYVALIVMFVLAIYAEYKDDRCSNLGDKRCGRGMGTSYVEGKLHKGDSFDTILKKIRITARYEVNSIMWRRCFIAAAIAAFIVTYLCKNKLPSGFTLVTAFLIIYISFYLTITTLQKVVTEPALKQMDSLLDALKDPQSRH